MVSVMTCVLFFLSIYLCKRDVLIQLLYRNNTSRASGYYKKAVSLMRIRTFLGFYNVYTEFFTDIFQWHIHVFCI